MAVQVASTATCKCIFGAAPAVLTATCPTVLADGMPAATIADIALPTFGMCSCPANPAVAAATAAALGVLTPQPCMPVPMGPWKPGSPTVLIGGKPALQNSSTLQCSYGGVITIATPGAKTVMVP